MDMSCSKWRNVYTHASGQKPTLNLMFETKFTELEKAENKSKKV